jgi:hypothetical protein
MAGKKPMTNAELVVFFGGELFGVEWVSAMARFTDTNQRTVSRIKAAALRGEDYPAARGVLTELQAALDHLAGELRPHSTKAAAGS